MTGILSLTPEDEKRLHPEALKWFNDRRADIKTWVPLEDLNDDDLNAFLSPDEKVEFLKEKYGLTKALYTCLDMNSNPQQGTESNIVTGFTLLSFQANLLVPMNRIGLLLKKIYQRKEDKARQEQRERDQRERLNREKAEAKRKRAEAEVRRNAAFKAINPPLSEASKYLKPDEYKKFERSISEAIDAFFDNPESYLNDKRVYNYRRWCREISSKRETEELIVSAKSEAQEYNSRLSKEIRRLRSTLCPNKKDHASYFQKEIRDHRYKGQSLAQLLSNDQKQVFDKVVFDLSQKKLDEIVSSDFRQFIEMKCCRSYFLLPSAEYSFQGVQCLDFIFEVFAVVEIAAWIKPKEKTFGGYVFDLPEMEEKYYSFILREPKLLGYYYTVLLPEDLEGYIFWQSIPLVLLRGLLAGEAKPSGTKILAASDGVITYKVPKFKGEVNIPDDLAGYLRNVGIFDNMVSMGIMTQKVAGIVKSESAEPKVEEKAPPLEERGRDSKKARAFQLFGQCKRPSDPKVKSLGIKPRTAYRYYQQWKKGSNRI